MKMGKDDIIVQGSREDSIIIRSLLKAASKDDARPVLTGVHIRSDGTMEVCDGHIWCRRPLPPSLQDLEPGVYDLSAIRSGNFRSIVEIIPGTYPKIPKIDEIYSGGAPVFEISLGPDVLQKLIHATKGALALRFKFYSPKSLVRVDTKKHPGDTDWMFDSFSVIMPRTPDDSDSYQPLGD